MGSLISDTATVSKAALLSAASVFSRRPTVSSSSPSSPPSQHPPDPPRGTHQDFDLEYMGPAKFAEVRDLEQRWLGLAPSDTPTAPVNGAQDNSTSPQCDAASPMTGRQLSPGVTSDCRSAELDAIAPSFCSGLVPVGMCSRTVMTSDGKMVPAHEAARSIMEAVFIQKGLASPGDSAFSKSLPQLLGMVPDSAEETQATQSARGAAPVNGDVGAECSAAGSAAEQGLAHSNAEPSAAGTAGPAGEQEAAVLARSNEEPSTAGTAGTADEQEAAVLARSNQEPGTAGGEPEEQWAGSLPPAQMAATAFAAAAENEAATQLPPDGCEAEAQRTSLDAGTQLSLWVEHLQTVI